MLQVARNRLAVRQAIHGQKKKAPQVRDASFLLHTRIYFVSALGLAPNSRRAMVRAVRAAMGGIPAAAP